MKNLILKIKDWWRGVPVLGGRSGQWTKVRAEFLKSHPNCEVCGREGKLLKPIEVHHIQVFHLNPQLELDPNNFISVCREHHLLVGHLMSFRSFNKDVVENSKDWYNKIKNRP